MKLKAEVTAPARGVLLDGGWESNDVTLSPRERVARSRRFHQPGRDPACGDR